MPKNKIAEVWNLPHIQRKITMSNNWSYPYINFSTYVDISGSVIQNILMTSFDLELEEPELPWKERLQDRKDITWHFRILKLILFPEVHWLTVQSPKNCANKACKSPNWQRPRKERKPNTRHFVRIRLSSFTMCPLEA